MEALIEEPQQSQISEYNKRELQERATSVYNFLKYVQFQAVIKDRLMLKRR